MSKIFGIDLGNYNIKTSEGLIFKATYSTEINNDPLNTAEYVELNGTKYYISKGGFDTEFNKADKDTLPLFLYALSKITTEPVVDVVLGLPIDQFRANKERIEKKFKGKFSFLLNGSPKTIEVKRVKCFPECIGAFYSLDDIEDDDFILVDIGGRTTNIALFVDGEHEKSNSIPNGAFNILTNFKNIMNTSHTLGLSIEDAERHIRKNELIVKGEQVDMSPLDELKEAYISELFRVLKMEYPIDTFKIVFTGGGSSLVYDKIATMPYRTGKTEEYLCANAIGFKRVGELTWLSK